MIKSLDNYRKLGPDEVIRKGDVYTRSGNINNPMPVLHSIGATQAGHHYAYWDFYRRRHTKKTGIIPTTKIDLDTPSTVKTVKHPVAIVAFDYNGTYRNVQLIKMDDSYLKGLEITVGRKGRKYQFKSFLRQNIGGIIQLLSYGPAQ